MENLNEVITSVTYIFFVYLILTLLVERLVEVLVAVFNYCELKFRWRAFWNRKAAAYQGRLERLYGYQGESATKTQKLFNRLLWKTIAEKPYEGGKDVISAELIRLNYIRVGTRVTAFLLSLFLVLLFETLHQFDLMAVVRDAILSAVPENVSKIVKAIIDRVIDVLSKNPTVKLVLTSAAVSIGTDPLHQLIRRIEDFTARKPAPSAGGEK